MTAQSTRSRIRGIALFALFATALAGALIAATLPRVEHRSELAAAATRLAEAPTRVTVATVRQAPKTFELTLPANAQGFRDASLYARTNGYIKSWLVDIGDRVKEGQLLTEISAPDVDDQLAQAQANLELAKANLQVAVANLELAKVTLKRDLKSGPGLGTSLLTIDQDEAQVKTTTSQIISAKASIQANEATVRQYAVLQSFQKIRAPFAGTITSRNVETGVLVTADNPSETRPIFHITQTDPLRVFVNVPQVNATAVAVDQQAVIFREENPGQLFLGRITRTANALDPNTRTLLTQIDVPNPNDALRPGMFVLAKFTVPRTTSLVMVPSAALVWRPDSTVVAVLDNDKKVRYHKVQVGRDFGIEVEVITGLEAGDTVVVHPGDALPEGELVEPMAMER